MTQFFQYVRIVLHINGSGPEKNVYFNLWLWSTSPQIKDWLYMDDLSSIGISKILTMCIFLCWRLECLLCL